MMEKRRKKNTKKRVRKRADRKKMKNRKREIVKEKWKTPIEEKTWHKDERSVPINVGRENEDALWS